VIHPSAIVDSARIGPGTRVWAFTQVMAGAAIGAECNIGTHCFIEAGAVIGDAVTVKNGNCVWSGVTLEDGAFVGPGVVFTNDRRPRSPRSGHARNRYEEDGRWLVPTVVGRGATLGAGAVVLAGVSIGAFGFVGAGAVVTRDVAAHALVVGNPARAVAWVCRCAERLEVDGELGTCPSCRLAYRIEGGTVVGRAC
jgi:UDP-2-acetamido-3-amino-2,3-dideoxy-glucuronate N-acetyltransferase